MSGGRICSAGLSKHQPKPVAPALAHAAALNRAKAAAVAREAVGDAMTILMNDDAIVERAVAHRGDVVSQVHLHPWRATIGRGREVGVREAAAVLRLGIDGVVAAAAASV